MNETRKFGGFSLFSLWAGAAISLAEIMTGSLIAPLGIKKGIILILAGHLIGCLILATSGLIGYREKKPAIISSRKSLGLYGSYIVSVFNIIQLVGWTAIMLIQCSDTVAAILQKSSIGTSGAILILALGVLVAVWAIFAEKGINIINNAAVVMLFILSLFMLIFILRQGSSTGLKIGTAAMTAGSALELSIVMPLSWVPLISDYTMAAKSGKASFIGSFTGYFIGSSFMYIIGLLATVFTGTSDVAGILNKLGFGIAGLLIVVLATVTTTYIDVFSAVMSTLNILPKLSKKALIVFFACLGTIAAIFFPLQQYENFLYAIGSVFAPIFAVILTDYFLIRADRSHTKLNAAAVISSATGTFMYYLFIKLDLPFGSTVPSMLVTATVYIALISILKKIDLGGQLDA